MLANPMGSNDQTQVKNVFSCPTIHVKEVVKLSKIMFMFEMSEIDTVVFSSDV